MLVRCTQKLLKALGVERATAELDEPGAGVFEEWYGNLIWVDRRKNLVFTDAATLFSFLIPDVKKRDWADFGKLFRSHLDGALKRQQLDPADLLTQSDSISFGRTRDRRILSSQNDLVFGYRAHIDGHGGLLRADIHEINYRINETPLKVIRYDSPSDRLRAMVGACHITTH
jgi:hypothetical protein